MNEIAKNGDKRMTVKEVAEALGVSERVVQLEAKRQFPELIRNGYKTYLNEIQVTAIKIELQKHHNLESKHNIKNVYTMDIKTRKYPVGYGIVQTDVMRMQGLSIGAKALYALLASYTGGKQYCFPSIVTMAHDLGVKDDTIYKYIKELKEKKLVIVSKLFPGDMRNNNKYEVCYIENEQTAQKEDMQYPENEGMQHPENGEVGHPENGDVINSINNNSIKFNNNTTPPPKASEVKALFPGQGKVQSETLDEFCKDEFVKNNIFGQSQAQKMKELKSNKLFIELCYKNCPEAPEDFAFSCIDALRRIMANKPEKQRKLVKPSVMITGWIWDEVLLALKKKPEIVVDIGDIPF